MGKRPNIIFFMLDQLRADSIGTFGESIVKTPNFDRIAEEGIAFNNCFVQHSVCTPSRCSIMTGWYPHVAGHRALNYLLHPDEPNMLKYLKRAGYHVEWHGKNDLLVEDGFEDSVDHRGKIGGKGNTFNKNPWDENHRLRKSFYFGEKNEEKKYDHDYYCVQNAIDFIKNQDGEKPFFLYLPLIYPHPPYNVEEPYFSMYDRSKMPLPAKADYSKKPRIIKKYHEIHGMDSLAENDYREIKATYYGMITRTDDLFGLLMDALREAGIEDDTAVFILSDHGDYTGDYGLIEKWWTGLTDNLVRTPLIFKVPGMKNKGKKHSELIESIDIFPTIMEIAGVENYHKQYGRSLLPLVNGISDSHRDCIFAEGGHNPQDLHCREEVLQGTYYPKTQLQQEDFSYAYKAVMARTRDWKYIKHLDDIPELYNVKDDPQEEYNLAEDNRYVNVIADMEKNLLDWYMKTCDNVPDDLDERDFGDY